MPHAARIWNHWMGGTDDFPADRAAGILRSPAELESVFDGLAFVEPGPVEISRWRPDDTEIVPIEAYGGVARKS